MREEVLTSLRRLQPSVRRAWEKRLRERPAVSAMALPHLLIPLMNWTLEAIWTDLRKGRNRESCETDWAAYCSCQANPLTGYFLCAKDSFIALFETDSPELPPMSPGEKQMCSIELLRALDRVAAREIKTFCSVCQQKHHCAPEPADSAAATGSVISSPHH